MKLKFVVAVLALTFVVPTFGQSKQDERLANSATVLQAILAGDKGLPISILNKADCVLIFPSVKKVAVGIGGSYGRGALVCRKGADMNGSWGAPAMYSLDQGSLGIQLGSTATDFVLVIMNKKGAEQIMNGKTKLGGNAEQYVELYVYGLLVQFRIALEELSRNLILADAGAALTPDEDARLERGDCLANAHAGRVALAGRCRRHAGAARQDGRRRAPAHVVPRWPAWLGL